MLGHSVRRVFGTGDVPVVNLARSNQVTEIVRSNIECFAAFGVLQVVVNSDWRLVVAEKEDRDGAGLCVPRGTDPCG